MARDRLALVSELPILEVTDDAVVIAAIAAEHGFDVRSLAKDLQRRQQGHPRLVSQPMKAKG